MKVYAFGLVFFYLAPFVCKAFENEGNNRSNTSLELFKAFIKDYNRVYADEGEFKKRLKIFIENLRIVEDLQKAEKGTALYGITQFSDWTHEEFNQLLIHRKSPISWESFEEAEIPEVEIPENHDWRDRGVVTPVKNQGFCGSCWAFAAVANIESHWAIKKGKLISLSEQQIVDCDTIDSGCSGGDMIQAYRYVKKFGGLESDAEYIYLGLERECKFDNQKIVVKISKNVRLPSQNEKKVARWLYKKGPVSAAVNATPWQFYRSGVLHLSSTKCEHGPGNHEILIVGYGVEKSKSGKPVPYWLIKNSWSTSWGEKGYIKLYRGDGTCGVDQHLASSIVA